MCRKKHGPWTNSRIAEKINWLSASNFEDWKAAELASEEMIAKAKDQRATASTHIKLRLC